MTGLEIAGITAIGSFLYLAGGTAIGLWTIRNNRWTYNPDDTPGFPWKKRPVHLTNGKWNQLRTRKSIFVGTPGNDDVSGPTMLLAHTLFGIPTYLMFLVIFVALTIVKLPWRLVSGVLHYVIDAMEGE